MRLSLCHYPASNTVFKLGSGSPVALIYFWEKLVKVEMPGLRLSQGAAAFSADRPPPLTCLWGFCCAVSKSAAPCSASLLGRENSKL